MAARLRHRESTDIDVIVRSVRSLGALTRPGPKNLAAQLGGTAIHENPAQIKVQMEHGIIDLNTAPVIPQEGHEVVEISSRRQAVLSTTQILRGKLERANDPAPVRDVYDVIRTADDPKLAGSLTAAYGLLIEDEQDAIETGWLLLDATYEEDATEELKLTEEPRADLAILGSTAALVLNNHRLGRLVITLEGSSLQIERTTRNGKVFTDTTTQEDAGAAMNRLGVNIHISDHNGSQAEITDRIEEHVENRRSGVVFDTADSDPEQRLDGRNPSMKRANAPTATGSVPGSNLPTFLPPDPALFSKAGVDHSEDTNVVRNDGLGKTKQRDGKGRSHTKKSSSTYDIR